MAQSRDNQELKKGQHEAIQNRSIYECDSASSQGDKNEESIALVCHDFVSKQNGDGETGDLSKENKTFENIFHIIGHNGRFQVLLVIMFVLINISIEAQNVHTVFTLTTPDHRCKLPGIDNDSYAIKGEHHAQLVDMYIPKTKGGGYRKCEICLRDKNSIDSIDTGSNITTCSDWVYDKSVMKRTLVEDLNLVCDRKVIRSHVNMVLFGGKMVAGYLQGYLSDLFGRRPSLIISCAGMLVAAIGSAFVFDPMSLIISRFMAGFFASYLHLSSYVMGIEFLTIKQRSLLSIFTRMMFGLCDTFIALAAYLLRDWHYLLLAVAWPNVFAMILCWLMPESPRWLISKNKIEKAEHEIQRVARMNRKTVPHGITRQLKIPKEQKKHSVLELFRDRRLTVRWIILYINWTVICMGNYGLTFYISNMSGNIFINFAASGVLFCIVAVFNSLIVNKLSRKYFYFSCSAIGSCACILTFVPILLDAPSWYVVVLSLIGKAAIMAAAPLLYTYSAELYPTTHRGVGVGSCSTMSRFGGLLSAYIADLSLYTTGKMASVLPPLVLGTCSILGTLLVLALPETRGVELPETMEDILMNLICVRVKKYTKKYIIKILQCLTEVLVNAYYLLFSLLQAYGCFFFF